MKKYKIITLLIIAIVLMVAFFYYENNAIKINALSLSFDDLPEAFHGFKAVHLSDLHGKSFGENQKKLIKKIKNNHPDVIFFTGDLVDSHHYNEGPGLTLMAELVEIAPVYFVMGNHEHWSSKFGEIESKLEALGVHVLRDRSVFFEYKVLSDELLPVRTTNYFIGLVRLNYKLRPERQALTFETTLYRRFV
jgi:hypothetical protein